MAGLGVVAIAGDAALAGAEIVAVLQEQAHFVGEGAAVAFVEIEAAAEFKFVSRSIVRSSQQGEETVT